MMNCIREVNENVYWIGGNDRRLSLFENIFPIPRGISYNAYVVLDEKTILLDTVDWSIGHLFFDNLETALQGRTLDYIVINHMEPDHCACLKEVINRYPEVVIVGNAKTFTMIDQFFGIEINKLVVKENDTLTTGKHTFTFVMAPLVHWPEVMVTYDSYDKTLYSADAFGTFGALDGALFNDEVDFEHEWLDDARRYYANIVGKYGPQVQMLLKKASSLEIATICPLHGPVWRNNIDYIVSKYDCWSKYEPEEKGVVLAYGSIYGNTENVMEIIASKLKQAGVKNVRMYDVSKVHVSNLISEVFHYSHLILAAPTYNSGIFPPMENFLSDMITLSLKKRSVALLENGTWGALCAKHMSTKLETMKDMEIINEPITIKSTLKTEQVDDIDNLVTTIVASIG
ncbi:FprA family A-type flavoprotein [Thomasclavelia ramosa]